MDMPEEIYAGEDRLEHYPLVWVTDPTPGFHAYTRTTKYDELKALCERMSATLEIYTADDMFGKKSAAGIALAEYTNFMKDKG